MGLANHLYYNPRMFPKPHDRFSSQITLTPDAVVVFATAAGDHNPIHHDPEAAAASRYGGLVASGPQTSGLLMGLAASHFAQLGPMVGLDFWFRFRRPVYADDTIQLEWLVIRVTPHARSGGQIVELRGRVRNGAGETAVGAKGRVLVEM